MRARIDALRDRLNAAPPPHTELLYPELRELFLRSGHRDEVKYSMALLSGFSRPEDADLFRVVGRHEEFTLYAAVALATVTDDPVDEWLGLLVARQGLGADGARGADPARTRNPSWCASSSCAAAWASATRSSLPTAAAWIRSSPTRRWTTSCSAEPGTSSRRSPSRDSPSDLADYGYAGWAVENLLRHLAERTAQRRARRAVAALQTLSDVRRVRYERETGADRFPACGLDEQRLARVLALCEEYLAA